MQGSSYYRMRADMCLRIAARISDSEAAKKLRTDAAHYVAWADEIDARAAGAVSHRVVGDAPGGAASAPASSTTTGAI